MFPQTEEMDIYLYTIQRNLCLLLLSPQSSHINNRIVNIGHVLVELTFKWKNRAKQARVICWFEIRLDIILTVLLFDWSNQMFCNNTIQHKSQWTNTKWIVVSLKPIRFHGKMFQFWELEKRKNCLLASGKF